DEVRVDRRQCCNGAIPMTLAIDHLMWGAPDLAQGMAQAQQLFGVEPAPGGAHPGLGTRNALLGLGDCVYLEIIAPDPEQNLHGTLGERLPKLDRCALVTWAAGCGNLSGLADTGAALGMAVRGPVRTQRRTPSDNVLEWELLFLGGHEFPSLIPFFIDWLDTPHPRHKTLRVDSFWSWCCGLHGTQSWPA
ncbi:MAG: VOC family protein, partial [Pseudomonadales bacterium]